MIKTRVSRAFNAGVCCLLLLTGCISSPDPEEEPVTLSWNLSTYQEIRGDIELVTTARAQDGLDRLEVSADGVILAVKDSEGAGSDTLPASWSVEGLARGEKHLFEAAASDLSGNEISLSSTCIVTGTESIIPLAVGNRWEYEGLFTEYAGSDTLVDSFSWVMEVRGTAPALDTTTYLLRFEEGEPIYDYNINYEDGFYYMGGWNYGNEQIPSSPLLGWLYPAEEPGEYYSGMFDEMVEVVSTSRSVTVPAGIFEDCMHYRRAAGGPGSPPGGSSGYRPPTTGNCGMPVEKTEYTWQGDYYFLPGTGLLKMTFITIDGSIRIVETSELTAYSIY